MRWDLLFFQQFLDSTLYSKLHERQPFGAQIVSAVPFESEIQEPAQMASVFMGQNPLRNHRIQRAFLSQAVQLKRLSQSGELNMDKIFEILREPKANQQEKISFRVDDLRKFFPKSYSVARIQERILKLLEADCRKRQRAQER